MAINHGQDNELQKLAYETLSEYFQEHADEVIEIEILPPALQPSDGIIMQDGSSLGLPKKVLVLAYVEARHRFSVGQQTQDVLALAQALQATKVMLLFDPEHLTAANYRKRTLSLLRNEFGLHIRTPYHRALRQELCFLNSILTSPLHRQSKSPTLWYHRSTIVDCLRLIELEDAPQDRIAEFWHNELAAVFKSGEQHPKNYHAWQYARRLVNRIESHGMADDVARRVKDWCCRHPSDISGWSFMLYLMPITTTSLQQELVADTINYAISLNCAQESLWIFIRTSLARSNTTFLASYQSLQAYRKDLDDTKRHPVAMERVCNAIVWIDAHRQSGI